MRMSDTLPLFARARQHADRTAIVDLQGSATYARLLDASVRIASALLDGNSDLREARVAFSAPPGFHYVAAQWGIWQAGGVAVPLGLQHPPAEWRHVIEDAQVSVLLATPDLSGRLAEATSDITVRRLTIQEQTAPLVSLPAVDPGRRAMIVYTSGTTSKPKGVVTTHANIQAQVESLITAWEWTAQDRILHVLPLHHVHGIINALTCALWAGAVCELRPRFDAGEVWQRLAAGECTLFMAVPTIYSRLIAAWEQADPERQRVLSEGVARLRLMVSGSAALPVTTLERWQQITGHVLLERYGMTEIGMGLSNPLHGRRIPGHVGTPLPGVEVRLVDEAGHPVTEGVAGEIQVRGPTVFLEYWNRPEATREAFRNGWFRTGDMAVLEEGSYRILGRNSVDIIKTGGYKVSALEIEEVLRTHPAIRECAVIGIPDAEWGERVGACLVLAGDASLSLDALREWARERLAAYKMPTRLLIVDELPRNAMGKVQKPAVAALFPASGSPTL
jgi:malonyl-CoA/methylmalonyl-CoA synthetase